MARMFLFLVGTLAYCFCAVTFVEAQRFGTDPRCPGWQGDGNRRRQLRPSSLLDNEEEEQETELVSLAVEEEEETQEEPQDERRELQDYSNLPTFQLKLHWEPGFCWQAEWDDRNWCMDCEGGNCNQGDMLEIQYCSSSRRQDQRLQWVPSSNNNPRVGRLKVAGSNLCYHRLDGRFYELRGCDFNSNRQVLIGFDYSRPFELLAQYDNSRCLNQQHDPREDESIELTACSTARRVHTNLWTVIERDGNIPSGFNGAGPAPTNPPPVEPNNPRVEPIPDDPPPTNPPPTNPPPTNPPPTNPPPTNPPPTNLPPTNPPDNVFQEPPTTSTNQLQQLPTNSPRHGVRSTATTTTTSLYYLTMIVVGAVFLFTN